MKKLFYFILFALSTITIFYGCKKEEENNPNNTESGSYMGIIGFNDALYPKDISLLYSENRDNSNDFKAFVNSLEMKNGTALYYAVDNAIDKLKKQTCPKT